MTLFVSDGGVFGVDNCPEGLFLDSESVDDDFEHFGELFLADEVVIEAELFDGTQDGQLLGNLQSELHVLEHLHYLVVVHGFIARTLLVECQPLILLSAHLQPTVDLVQLSAQLQVHSKILRVVLNPLLEPGHILPATPILLLPLEQRCLIVSCCLRHS